VGKGGSEGQPPLENETVSEVIQYQVYAMRKRIYLFPTFGCTLSCPECYQGNQSCSASWSQQEWSHVRARMRESEICARECVFTGGEPTVWSQLPDAVDAVKTEGIARYVRVLSNGWRAQAQDYGSADVVQISNYGGVNCLSALRLKKELGRRLRIQNPIHFDLKNPKKYPPGESLPGRCHCDGLSFAGDRVYPCAYAAGNHTGPSRHIDEPFANMMVDDPHRSELCQSCPVNRRNRLHYMPSRQYLQIGLWEGPGWLVPIPRTIVVIGRILSCRFR
jgi:hypothetical protein